MVVSSSCLKVLRVDTLGAPVYRYVGITGTSDHRVLDMVLFLEGIILPVRHIHFRALCNVCTRRGGWDIASI
jgi:hypothetical protein